MKVPYTVKRLSVGFFFFFCSFYLLDMIRYSLFKHWYQADLEALPTPGRVDEKRTGIQDRYKQICNILSIGRVGRGLSPPDKRNKMNILLRRNTLVLVLDCSHRTCTYLLSVFFYF